jgi:hypothetical protein
MLNLSAFLGGFHCCSDTISPHLAHDPLFKAAFIASRLCVLHNDLALNLQWQQIAHPCKNCAEGTYCWTKEPNA